MVMVLAPRAGSPASQASISPLSAGQSKPQCAQKRLSSAATTASASAGAICASGCQSFSRPSPSARRISIRGVIGGGRNR